jgi:hypothetical protein
MAFHVCILYRVSTKPDKNSDSMGNISLRPFGKARLSRNSHNSNHMHIYTKVIEENGKYR